MALLKTKELRVMRPEDMQAKLQEFLDELMHERGVAAMGGAPASPGKISVPEDEHRTHPHDRAGEGAGRREEDEEGWPGCR